MVVVQDVRVVVVWVLLMVSASIAADTTGQRTQQRPDPVALTLSQWYVGFEAEYERRRVKYDIPNQRDREHTNTDLRIRETTGLTLDGHLFTPEFASFQGQLESGLEQARFSETIDWYNHTEWDDGLLSTFDVSMDMLQDRPVSLNMYARRTDDRIARRFLPSLDEETTEMGVSALAQYGTATTEFGFSWYDQEITGNDRFRDDEDFESTRFYVDHKWQFTDHHSLSIAYDHEQRDTRYQGSGFAFDTQRDEVRVEHDLAFGDQHQHRLDTYMRVNVEQGALARDELEVVPRLSLRHSDALETVYRYGFYQFDDGELQINQHKLDAQVLYRPTDELRLSGDVFGMFERTDLDIDTHQYGTGLDASWRKPTPWGEFTTNAAFAYDRTDTRGDGGIQAVRGEAHTLGGVVPAYLRQQNIERFSIVAYNASRTRLYVPGQDYVVQRIGSRVAVQRTLTGRIVEGEVVYFDYAYRVPLGSRIDTYRMDVLLEHRFDLGPTQPTYTAGRLSEPEGAHSHERYRNTAMGSHSLTPYYYWEARRQDIDPAQPVHTAGSVYTPAMAHFHEWYRSTVMRSHRTERNFILEEDNTNRHRIGLRYDRHWWELTGELELFNDSIEPYDAYHLWARADVLRSAAHTMDVRAELSRYLFDGSIDRRNVWWFDVDLSDRMQLTRYLSLFGTIGYRWEDDSHDGTTNGVDVECGLRLRRGALAMELTVEYDLLEFDRSSENGLAVFLNVRRDLSGVLASAERGRRR